MKLPFDITAPLERQRTRDGRLISGLYLCEADVDSPLVAWIQGQCAAQKPSPHALRADGLGFANTECDYDLHTLPEPLPLIVSYHNVYLGDNYANTYSQLADCVQQRGTSVIATVETTFHQNTGIASAKTVWRKGE